jgi:hypothetical protein
MAGLKTRRQRVFFYGSFMNPKILTRYRAYPTNLQTARLKDWAIDFTPLATIVRRKRSAVWGVLAMATPRELERIYGEPVYPGVGAGHKYYPVAVMVSTRSGHKFPALVYVSYKRGAKRPSADYLDILIRVSKRRRFPDGYIRQLARLR